MTSDEALRQAAEQGDRDAMFELAEVTERQARTLLGDAREWYSRAARAGSLEASLALAGLAVQEGDYENCRWHLADAERRHVDVPADRLVTVAPDVLGPRLSLDGDGADEFRGAGVFTVISPHARRAAGAVARVASQLLYVDEHGVLDEGLDGEAYTPNYLYDVKWCGYGAMVSLDTKSVMWAAMGRTMVGILVGALAADRVPAHITGYRGDLDTQWSEWAAP
jgi:TPR repeat protein